MANYNVDIEVGLKGLNRLQQFKRDLEAVDTAYLNIISLTKRLEKQGGLKKFYEGGREQLLKLAGDQMKLDSMLKQGAEIRAGYAKDRQNEQQKLAESQKKAAAQRIADEKRASIAAKNVSVQRLNDQTKIVRLFRQAEEIRELHAKNRAADRKDEAKRQAAAIIADKNEQLKLFSVKAENEKKFRSLFEQGEKIRQSYAADRLAGIKLEIQLEEELNKTKRDGIAADQRRSRARQEVLDQADKELAVRNRGRSQQQKDRKKFFNAAVTGGAFPLLFGGGVGQSLGGLVGGGLSGEMFSGYTVGLQVLGSAIDNMVGASANLGKALDPISGSFETVAEAAGFANTETLQHIQTIDELGEKNRSLEVATNELSRVVGADGVKALEDFGTASKDLSNETAKVASQAFATIAAALGPLTRAAARFLKTTATVGQAQVSQDPRIKEIRAELKERMQTYDNKYGGMNNLENRQAIRDLRAEEASLVEILNRTAQVNIELEAEALKKKEAVKALNLKTEKQIELQNQLTKAGNDLTDKRVVSLKEEQILENFRVATEKKLKEMREAGIPPKAVVLKLTEMAADKDEEIARLTERANSAVERKAKNSKKAAEQSAKEAARTAEQQSKEFKQAQDLSREFSREVQLRQAGSSVARELLEIQFQYEDQIRKINELEDQSLKTQLEASAAQINTLKLAEAEANARERSLQAANALRDSQAGFELQLETLKANAPGQFAGVFGGSERTQFLEELKMQQELARFDRAIGAAKPEDREDLEKERDQYKLYQEQIIEATVAQQQFSEALALTQPVTDSLFDSLMAVANGTKTAQESFADFLRSIASMLVDVAKRMIATYIAIGVARMFAGVPGAEESAAPASKYGAAANLAGPAGDFGLGSGPMFPFPTRALGGAVGAGQPYLVGERGPELFVPGAQGNIVPNNAMSGANVTVNVDASGSSVQGDSQSSSQLGKAIGAAVQAELIKQKRPGGLLTR